MLASPWVKALCVAAVALVRATNADAIDDQATQIVDSMTDAQLIGQMAQVNVDEILGATGSVDPEAVRKFAKLGVGSYLNSPFAGGDKNGKYGWTATEWQAAMKVIQDVHKQEGTPPVIYGIDSVHGANYVLGATIFGQQINAGASFNPDLVYKMGQITGRDTLAGGMSWIFGPILEIAQNPLWSRTYETFGEDPYLVSVMGSNIIQGIQNNTGVAACMKHFIGYSKLVTGHDRDPVTLSDFDLLNYFAPPFIAAIKAGVMSGMENYISINGVPTVASAKLMKDLLRKDLGFEGFIVTDWAEIQNLVDYHRVAKTPLDAVRMSLTRTTIDMSMVSYNGGFIDYAKQVLADTPSIKDRIKDSVRRIIKTKLALGLYTTPVPGASLVSKVGQAEDRAVALALAQESIVLLQNNNNVLPLSKTAKVFLTGHSAHNIGNQCGGWSLRWQGYTGNSMYPNGISIKTAMQKVSSSVTFYAGDVETGDNMYANTATALQQLQSSGADTVVVVIGEKPYTEKPGDIEELALDAEQVNYVKQLKAANKKVVVVLIGGRPRLLGDIPSVADAIVNAMLPGELGGQAISDILYGDVNPSGRLPLTYQKNPSNVMLPYNRPVTALCKNDPCLPQWAFGTGLSYTKFDYTLQLSKSTVTGSTDSLVATVTVKNSGSRDGKETVMLFISQKFREIAVPELKQLKRFKKISLKAGEQTAVSFTLDASDWSFYDPQIGNGLLRRAEDGDFIVSVKPETTCDVYGNPYSNPLCAKFTLSTVNTVSTDGAGTVVAFNG